MSDSKWKEMAERTTILRCLTGSQAYGLALEDGLGDRDEVGVCLEDMEAHLTLRGQFEQYVYRTATARTGQHDAKSQPGDLDLTIYGLKKFLQLAAHGNPNIVELLFYKSPQRLTSHPLGTDLQALAPLLVSRQTGQRYLGYMQAQKSRLMGERGGKDVNRPELVEKYGYDTKYASHIIRLGFQGEELLESGRLELPMHEIARGITLGVKEGKYPLNAVLELASQLENNLKDLTDNGPLRPLPDYEAVEKWMQNTYMDIWNCRPPYFYRRTGEKAVQRMSLTGE